MYIIGRTYVRVNKNVIDIIDEIFDNIGKIFFFISKDKLSPTE